MLAQLKSIVRSVNDVCVFQLSLLLEKIHNLLNMRIHTMKRFETFLEYFVHTIGIAVANGALLPN
jgi:hypothetical protein